MSIPDPWPLIHKKFPSNEYALLAEVRDKAGHYASRSADGVAVNLWPSRGLHVSGIEIKSYRSDWLNELKKPAKAEAIYKFCDYWWIIAAAENIVKPEEVPKTWGFMEVRNGKLKVIIEAPKLTPTPMDRHFIAALLKRATSGTTPTVAIESRIEELVKERMANKSSQAERTVKSLETTIADLRKTIWYFEEKSGVRITGWDAGKVTEAVQFVKNGGIENLSKQLINLQKDADKISATIGRVLSESKIEINASQISNS